MRVRRLSSAGYSTEETGKYSIKKDRPERWYIQLKGSVIFVLIYFLVLVLVFKLFFRFSFSFANYLLVLVSF